MMVRTRLLVVSATLLLAGACFYKFNNPVYVQANGSIAGQLMLSGVPPTDGGQTQTLAGAKVTLLWSGVSIKVDQSNGKFIFLLGDKDEIGVSGFSFTPSSK